MLLPTFSTRGRRVVGVVVGAGALLVAVQRLVIWAQLALWSNLQGPDFFSYYAIARQELARGPATVYDLTVQFEFQRQITSHWPGQFVLLPHLLPPYDTLLLVPLGWLSFRQAYVVMGLGIIACVTASTLLLLRSIEAERLPSVLLGLLAAAYFPIFILLLQGQSDGVALIALTGSALLWMKGRDAGAGALAALALVKPQMMLLVPALFLVRGSWRGLAAFAGVAMLQIGISLPWFGVSGWRSYLSLVLPWAVGGHAWFPVQAQSTFGLRGLVTMAGAGQALSLLILAISASGVLLILRRCRADPALELALVVASSVALSPYQHMHDLALLLIPMLLVVRLLHRGSLRWPLLAWPCLVLAYLSPQGLVPLDGPAPALGVVVLAAYVAAEIAWPAAPERGLPPALKVGARP